jgi:hypothetical protein
MADASAIYECPTGSCIKEGYLRLYISIIEKFSSRLFEAEIRKYGIEPMFSRL